MTRSCHSPTPVDVAVRPGDVVIDGGGCWAETSLHFAHLAGPEGRVETFEFDPSNLETLRRNLALNPELAERVHVHPHPLWHTAGERLTYASNGPGTRVGSDGAGPGVKTATIDALVASGVVERIDFVKLDIEGAELSALQGAADTLRRFRPRLAIAAYHKPDDLVVLPAFLEDLGVGYRVAIGHYTMAVEETILFAWCDDEA
jgi:FkbM family methyltransferase